MSIRGAASLGAASIFPSARCRRGELDATPMRMDGDTGAATAEAVRADMEGRTDELPFVFLVRVTVAHDQMSVDEINALEPEAFRFSGVGALKR